MGSVLRKSEYVARACRLANAKNISISRTMATRTLYLTGRAACSKPGQTSPTVAPPTSQLLTVLDCRYVSYQIAPYCKENYHQSVLYRESKDGINWPLPSLGLVPYNG